MAATSNNMHANGKAQSFRITAGENVRIMFEAIGRHALALGAVGVGLASAIGVSAYIQQIRTQVIVQEERMKANEERTKVLVETAKRETTERFLMYRYAEEFQRFQRKLGMRPTEQIDDKST